MEHAARPVLLPELRVLRVVVGLRLLLGVQVVEVAEELVEPVHGRQVRVAVAQVVLAELAGGVALLLEQVGDGGRPVRYALRGARHADGEQAGAERVLAEDERSAARRAALLGVGVREQRPFLRDAVDVRRLVAHHAEVVGADVVDADVITPDHEDVGLLVRRLRRNDSTHQCRQNDEHGQTVAKEFFSYHGLSPFVACFVLHPRRYCSNANMRFQSFFMLMTVQPCFFASSYSAWVKAPTLVSGSPKAGP